VFMSTEAAFLHAIIESPNDDFVRLVYADWLEDRGDPRGTFIRLQCRLETLSKDSEIYDGHNYRFGRPAYLPRSFQVSTLPSGRNDDRGQYHDLTNQANELLKVHQEAWVAPCDVLGLTLWWKMTGRVSGASVEALSKAFT
jgi:uncharacterized protein (TIGR02996 family)